MKLVCVEKHQTGPPRFELGGLIYGEMAEPGLLQRFAKASGPKTPGGSNPPLTAIFAQVA